MAAQNAPNPVTLIGVEPLARSALARGERRDHLIHDLSHIHGGCEIEFVYRDKSSNASIWRKGDIGKRPLEAPGLLKDQRTVAVL